MHQLMVQKNILMDLRDPYQEERNQFQNQQILSIKISN